VHEVFGADDGLPVAGILQALQTRDGYLWLATFDGLSRFDGIRFELFDSERVPALGSNRITDLAEGRDGDLWILSEQGHLVRYRNGDFTACGAPQAGRAGCALRQAGPPLFTILAADPSGTLWTGGPSGLYQIVGGELRQVPGLQPGMAVRSLFWDRTGGIWAGLSRALWHGRPGHFAPIALPAGSFDLVYPTVAEDPEGGIWAATSLGAGRVRGGSWSLEAAGAGVVVQGPDGSVWISLQEKAQNRLLHYRSEQLATVAAGPLGDPRLLPGRNLLAGPGGELWISWAHALYRDNVEILRLPGEQIDFTSLLFDREGTLWATTSRGELHAFHPSRLTAFGSAAGLPLPNVYPVYEDRDGTIWTGGTGFLASLPGGEGSFRVQPGPAGPLQGVLSFLRDRAGTFWVGTVKGLFTLDARGFSGPVGPQALQAHSIRALYEDARGALWVGTDAGLFRRGPPGPGERWSLVTSRFGPSQPWVRVIRETPDGALWLGTNGGGVIRLAGGRFTAITQAQGLSSDLVRAIWPAPDGRLWIATENRGIDRLDPATVDRPGGPRIDAVGSRRGLFASGVHQIVADTLNHLWMSSNKGIFRVRLDDLNAVADGARKRLDCTAFTERDGMIHREANGSVQDAGLRDRAGRIWFPTQGGLVRFVPRRLLAPQEPPPVHVEGLRLGDTETPVQGGAVRLEPPHRSFAFELSAPSFLAPERLRLRFRLVPYDHDWIEAGTRREAAYTKVPPGHYRFEVAAASPDGTWSRSPTVVAVEVVPRFYETRWFLFVCGLAALAALGAAVRLWEVRSRARRRELELLVEDRTHTIALQAKELRELDRLRSELFANVSHELRTPLTLILGSLQDARAGRFGLLGGDLAAQLQVAERNAQSLLGLVDQLLDVARLDAGGLRLDLRREDLAALVRRSVESFLPLAERRKIDLTLAVPAEPVEVRCDEVQIEKVLGNLLSNALKFTPARGAVRVEVTAAAWAEQVQVTVQDTGPGIPADQLERIFERFYQVPTTDRRRRSGAGIGLALARELTELHGGTITAESAGGPPGQEGSRFLVTLQRAVRGLKSTGGLRRPVLVPDDAPAPRPAGGPAADPEDDRTIVLVVDDNADMRAYVRRHLEPDYRVEEAADGIEGLEQSRRLQPDLIVSDVMMPGLDGNALFRSLREDPDLALVPVILLTAKASTESRIEGLREGVDDYLIKPFDPRELKARLDNLVASRRRLLERFAGAAPPLQALQVSEIEVTPADESFLKRVQATVEARLDDPTLTVEALADALGCDRSYLLRKLRALTGETPSDLIRSLRLQRAEQLLRAGAGAVSEIAYSVGFKSVAHFSNAFHARYGERPSAFAARHRR
jgi:signal transduction histidine kinase/ligand-binding sensor domain-containing protein/DNA-binding response OmpR family regulator